MSTLNVSLDVSSSFSNHKDFKQFRISNEDDKFGLIMDLSVAVLWGLWLLDDSGCWFTWVDRILTH